MSLAPRPTRAPDSAEAPPAVDRTLPEDASALDKAVSGALSFLDRAKREPTGLLGGLVVLVVCLLVTWALWHPLSWPALWLNGVVGNLWQPTCGAGGQGFTYSLCGMKLALASLIGALTVMGILFLARRQLKRALQRGLSYLPEEASFLAVPLVTAVVFTMAWAGVQFHFFDRPGLVRDGFFPAVVGVITYATQRTGPWLQRTQPAFFEARDRLSQRQRMALLIAIPIVASLLLTPFLHAPKRDQVLALIGILGGFLLMLPAAGQMADRLKEAFGTGDEEARP